MENDDITIDPLVDAKDVIAPDGGEAVKDVTDTKVTEDSLTLEALNKELGKDFPSMEAALKSVKDTNSYVGKRQEKVVEEAAKSVNEDVLQELKNATEQIEILAEDNFYAKNPQYVPMKDMIRELGGNPEVVVQSEAFKGVFAKVEGYEKNQGASNVLKSNPRITEARDSMEKARTLSSEGNKNAAEDMATQAVLESIAK